MVKFIKLAFRKYKDTFWRFRLNKSNVRVVHGGIFSVGKNIKILGCKIYVDSSSSLIIDDNVELNEVSVVITNGGRMHISHDSIIKKERNCIQPEIICDRGGK